MSEYNEPSRKPISRRMRFEILRRDNYTCRYCGASAPDATLTVDHVIPITLGGGDDPTNLVTACRDCNAGKSSTRPDDAIVADVDAAALLFAEAMARAAEIRREETESAHQLNMIWRTRWNGFHRHGVRMPLPDDWEASLIRHREAGLSCMDQFEMIDPTMAARGVYDDNRFRYYCGIAWREIGQRQELARRLIEDGAV